MATSPLFFSSSPSATHVDHDLDSVVDEVYERAQLTTEIETELQEVFAQNKTTLITFIKRRLDLIESRSQDWKSGQVTIFDKVLVKLIQEEDDISSPAVLTYFCKEFMGMFGQVHADSTSMDLSDSMAISNGTKVKSADSPPKSSRENVAKSFEQSDLAQQENVLRGHGLMSEEEEEQIAGLASNLEPITERLWQVYTHAKIEFSTSDGMKKQESAKFLRDTAENLMHRLQSISADVRLINEVGRTLQAATVITTSLLGGKKRKFDQGAETPGTERSISGKAAQTGRTRRPRSQSYPERRHKKVDRELFLDSPMGIDRYRPERPERSERVQDNGHDRNGSRHRYNRAPDAGRFPQKKMRGRGHSSIPYGYSRPVDSYYPE